ncbi:hypothetical protein HanPSC8_Chr00c520g0808921 [Helianthus annuus]|nr:hypothetical protein HanPSC8_Chr00c520g0808921 [Helianthus annuus]
MSTKEHLEDSSEEMFASLPPLKWSKDIFDGLVKNFKFLESWGVRYPEEAQTAAHAPAGYITLFWDYFSEGNFRLPATKFVLDILDFCKFHISQLTPMGMVRIRDFEFLCRSMHIEPTVDRFRAAVIPMRMTFRGFEYIEVETLKTPETEIWYQDLKDVPSIELPERALVAARMSLHWRMNRHDKPVYMEDDKVVALYVVAFKREIGKMTTVQKGADEASWYHQIIKNFVLPKDHDLTAQPSAGASKFQIFNQYCNITLCCFCALGNIAIFLLNRRAD